MDGDLRKFHAAPPAGLAHPVSRLPLPGQPSRPGGIEAAHPGRQPPSQAVGLFASHVRKAIVILAASGLPVANEVDCNQLDEGSTDGLWSGSLTCADAPH